MKYKFIRRSLIDSMSLFKVRMKNRSGPYDFSLKNKSNIILFFHLYILDNLLNRLIVRDLIGISSDHIEKFDKKTVYPPEGPVKDKKFLYSYRKKFFGARRRLKIIYYFKDYFTSRLNFISNYSSEFGDISSSSRLNYGFNLLNNTLLEKYRFINRKLSFEQLQSINHKYIIDDVTFRKFYRLNRPYKKSGNFVKMIKLLQGYLNLKFVSYFKILYEVYLSREKYLFSFLEVLDRTKFNINIDYLEFIKIIFINYMNAIMANYNNNVNKKEIILNILCFYRDKKTIC